jgi:DNA polymerase-1
VQEVVDEFNANSNTDFHQVVAEMARLERSAAKKVNFGIIYGVGPDSLCFQLGISREECDELLREYHNLVVRPLMNHYKDKAKHEKTVRTLYGRRRHFDRRRSEEGRPGVDDRRLPNVKPHAALNARIQGSAADIMKDAMVKVWESGVCDVIGAPHLTVHDELDLSSPDTKAGHEAVAEVKHIMEHTAKLSLPLKVDAQLGGSWGACE